MVYCWRDDLQACGLHCIDVGGVPRLLRLLQTGPRRRHRTVAQYPWTATGWLLIKRGGQRYSTPRSM